MTNVTIVFPEPLKEGDTPQIKDDEQGHFHETVNRAMYFAQGDNVESCTIHLRERTKPKEYGGKVYDEGGWLEHLIITKYVGGRQFVVGAIQRCPGAKSEFHS
jgi:hypothetical protein